jgi:hypothetical protein
MPSRVTISRSSSDRQPVTLHRIDYRVAFWGRWRSAEQELCLYVKLGKLGSGSEMMDQILRLSGIDAPTCCDCLNTIKIYDYEPVDLAITTITLGSGMGMKP